MESFRAIKYFASIANYTSFFGFIPYTWPRHARKILVKKSSRISTCVRLTWLFSQVLFMLLQLYLTTKSADVSFFEKIRIMYLTIGISIFFYNVSVVYNDPEEIPALLNNLFRLTDKIYGRSSMKGKLASKAMAANLRALKLLCTFIAASYSLPILRRPEDPKFLTSWTTDPQSVPIQWRILIGLYHTYAIAIEFGIFQFTWATVMVFTVAVEDVIKATRNTVETSWTLNPHRIHRRSQELGVLMQHFNATFCRYTISMEFVAIVSIVVNSTLALMQSSFRAFVIASVFFVLVLYQYKSYGMVYEESKCSLKVWRSKCRSIWFQKYCRAYRPPRVSLGSVYFADKSLMLTVLSIVLTYTASLCMAVRDGG